MLSGGESAKERISEELHSAAWRQRTQQGRYTCTWETAAFHSMFADKLVKMLTTLTTKKTAKRKQEGGRRGRHWKAAIINSVLNRG